MTKQKRKLLGILQNTYCRLKRSKIDGIGVFAIRDIPKNKKLFTGIARHCWFKFKMSELKNLDSEILKMIEDFFVRENDNTIFIPKVGLDGIDISFFVNNSAKPNVRALDTDVTTFIARRKIKKGEELSVSYKTYDRWYK